MKKTTKPATVKITKTGLSIPLVKWKWELLFDMLTAALDEVENAGFEHLKKNNSLAKNNLEIVLIKLLQKLHNRLNGKIHQRQPVLNIVIPVEELAALDELYLYGYLDNSDDPNAFTHLFNLVEQNKTLLLCQS